MKILMVLLGLGLTQAAMAQNFVEVRFKDGTQETYVILEKAPGSKATIGFKNSYDLTVLRVGPDRSAPTYTVAKTSKLSLITVVTKLGGVTYETPETLSGELPEKEVVNTDLVPVFHTMELKPEGTILATFCGDNLGKGADKNVTEVCLSNN